MPVTLFFVVRVVERRTLIVETPPFGIDIDPTEGLPQMPPHEDGRPQRHLDRRPNTARLTEITQVPKIGPGFLQQLQTITGVGR